MQKEPMKNVKETVLPEVKRGKRKVPKSEHGIANISYLSLFDLYLRECKKNNLAEETIQGYRHSTRYFLDFAGHDLMCYDVTQDLINEYYLYLQEYHKATTVNSYVFKVSPTVLYGVDKGYIKERIEFTHCKEQMEIKEIYTAEELEVLLKRPTENDFCEFRAWVIINLLISTGIRAKELRFLRVKDVNLQNGYIILNATKNKDARILPMPTTLCNIMTEWLEVHNASGEDWLFCNIFGEQMQRSGLQTDVKRYSKRRGVNRYGLHLYRHTFITLSIRNGMDSVMLRRITGHKSARRAGELAKMTTELEKDIKLYLEDRTVKQIDLMKRHGLSRNTLKKYIEIVKNK